MGNFFSTNNLNTKNDIQLYFLDIFEKYHNTEKHLNNSEDMYQEHIPKNIINYLIESDNFELYLNNISNNDNSLILIELNPELIDISKSINSFNRDYKFISNGHDEIIYKNTTYENFINDSKKWIKQFHELLNNGYTINNLIDISNLNIGKNGFINISDRIIPKALYKKKDVKTFNFQIISEIDLYTSCIITWFKTYNEFKKNNSHNTNPIYIIIDYMIEIFIEHNIPHNYEKNIFTELFFQICDIDRNKTDIDITNINNIFFNIYSHLFNYVYSPSYKKLFDNILYEYTHLSNTELIDINKLYIPICLHDDKLMCLIILLYLASKLEIDYTNIISEINIILDDYIDSDIIVCDTSKDSSVYHRQYFEYFYVVYMYIEPIISIIKDENIDLLKIKIDLWLDLY